MKTGIAATIRQLPSRPQPLVDVYREQIEGFVLADTLGFDHVWLAEHHFADDAHNTSAMPVLAAVAPKWHSTSTCLAYRSRASRSR